MKPDPAAPVEPLHLLRQQLILAQVRIMELEDARDELAPKLADMEKLLAAAQVLADAKANEAAHLAKVLTDLQAQCDHLRHMQHVTNEALNGTRIELAQATAGLAAAEQRSRGQADELAALRTQAGEMRQAVERLGFECATATALAATRGERINQLDREIRAMKASRSWRWTRWLRGLERTFGRGDRP